MRNNDWTKFQEETKTGKTIEQLNIEVYSKSYTAYPFIGFSDCHKTIEILNNIAKLNIKIF